MQINCLKERRRNELEQLLAVFDQSNITKDWHILNVSEEDFPEKFRPIIRRLKSAARDKEVKRQMKAEDEFIRYLQDCIRVERDKAIEEKYKTIEENKKSLAEKDKEIEELKKLLEKLSK
jgi:DNA repair exonuclease SbcCD ATPase subunit